MVKVEHGHGSQPGLFQQLEFLFVRGEQLGPIAGVRQGQTRMFLEGHHHGQQPPAFRLGLDLVNEVTVAAMHAVEEAHCRAIAGFAAGLLRRGLETMEGEVCHFRQNS